MPGKVRNIWTAGGPHMGVDKIPGCFTGAWCNAINWVVDHIVYATLAQDLVSPAGYFRDVNNLKTYS